MEDLELKNIITDIRKSLDELIRRMELTEENKLDHSSIKII